MPDTALLTDTDTQDTIRPFAVDMDESTGLRICRGRLLFDGSTFFNAKPIEECTDLASLENMGYLITGRTYLRSSIEWFQGKATFYRKGYGVVEFFCTNIEAPTTPPPQSSSTET